MHDVMSVMYTDAGRGHPWASVFARARVAAVGGRTGISGGHKTVQVRFRAKLCSVKDEKAVS